MTVLQSIFDTCVPRDEILAGELSLDLFAAKLRLVVEGNAPPVYQDPAIFFANTFPTDGLTTLLSEVFGRLVGVSVGSPIIRLETSFGGGKTHDLIALWHIAKNGRRIQGLERFVDNLARLPDRPIQVAAIACQDLDPVNGVYHLETGITTYTVWGEIAYQIGGVEGYSLLRGSDEQRTSPGTVVLERLMKGEPTLIVLDEIARYLRAAKAITVGNSDLAGQVVAFLFSLMDLASACNNLVFVYALASSSDSFGEETTDIREAIQTSARQERVLSPSTDVEIYNIVKQRIFSSVSDKAAKAAAKEYLTAYRASRLTLPDGCKDSHYAQVIEDSYPFHPELFSLLTKKIASIPNFQRTRGALRLFARLIRYLWLHREVEKTSTASSQGTSSHWTPLIHPHHLPVGIEAEITSDLTSRLERPLMRLPIQADIYNPDGREAHAQIQDREWLVAGKPPFSSWIARTIFLHSINQGITAGIRRPELNLSLLTPGLEISFVETAFTRLISVAWYLDHDPVTSISRFKEEPSINKIIAEEKEQVGQGEAKEELRSRRNTIFADKFFKLVASPGNPGDVDDVAESIALCLIDFDEQTVKTSMDEPPQVVERIFNNTGESGKFRIFRNRLLFLVANKHELERAINLTREYRAVQKILKSPTRLADLSESQQKQLKEKGDNMNLDVRVALTNAYRHLFYPSYDLVKAPKGLMHFTLSAQDTGSVKGKNNQQEVILEVLKDCHKIRPEDASPLAPAYVLQKVWPSGLDHLTTKALREAFAKDLGLNILLDADIPKLRDTIRKGLQAGEWDLKVGDRVFIKPSDGAKGKQGSNAMSFTLPETIEFSDRMTLYRRGILEPPKPREIELSAQVMPSTEVMKPVRVRWRAPGALTISLYQDGQPVSPSSSSQSSTAFRPSDEYEGTIAQTTVFRLVAGYGNDEIAQTETTAKVLNYSTGGSEISATVSDYTSLFQVKPEQFELEGTPNLVFNGLNDRVLDHEVKGITTVEFSVSEFGDYRRLTTALSLLGKFPIQMEQTATIQTGDQFLRLEYQGTIRGFQNFLTPTTTLLGSPNVQGNVMLKVIINFPTPVEPSGREIQAIAQALGRNPVDRLNLRVGVCY